MSVMEPRSVTLRDGREATLRSPCEADAQAMLEYIDAVRRETPHIYLCPRDALWTRDEQRQRIREAHGPDAMIVLAECDGRIVGMAHMHREKRYKLRHVATFGMTVRHDFRGVGLGRAILNELIVFGRAHPEILKIHIGVYPDNPPAMELYRRLGFIEEGRFVRHLCEIDGTFHDEVKMYLWVGEQAGAGS